MNEVVNVVDTTLRDGQMSLWATAVTTDMILPIAETMDQAGFAAIEILAAGGFEKKMVRELCEDPWQRIDLVRQRIRNTPLRVIRGRYLAAFQQTPQSIEELWWERIAAHGIREARLADASNTVTGWKVLVERARRVGIEPIVNLIYSVSPRHTDEYYAQKARAAAALNVGRICIKDPGGLLTPERTRSLVPAVQQNVGSIPLEFHTHCNTGLGAVSVLEAIKLGIRYVNTAIPPLAEASSNPSLFNVIRNARTLGYAVAVDEERLTKVEQHFTSIARRYGFPVGAPAEYDCAQYIHQVPGGMISNLRYQLSNAGLGERLQDVLEETAKVRADFGYPIMVTPYSQFVGVQATMNVILGERYKEVSDEVIQYALGLWGKDESESMDPNIRDQILNRSRTREVARKNAYEPPLSEVRQKYGGQDVSDDDLLLRYIAGQDEVAAMRAKGLSGSGISAGQSAVRLIDELAKRRDLGYIHIAKGTMSITLRSRDKCSVSVDKTPRMIRSQP